MRIALLAPLWIEIPPKKFGGTERVINAIDKGLNELGHDVTLFACKGSISKGRVIEVIDSPMLTKLGKFDFTAVQPYEFLSFSKLIDHQNEFDIVHNHMGIHPLILSKALKIPFVTTYHSSVAPDFPYLAEEFRNENFISISNAQRQLAPNLNWIETIYNPTDLEKYKPNYSKDNKYLLFIGALNKNKGVDIAVKAANELKEKLIIAGIFMKPEDEIWFKTEVMPLIDGEKIKFIGEVNDEEKVKLYRNAKAFLFPSQWFEAFGLVMVEALASGTPVIGYNNGAIPEVIKSGENGYIASNYNEFLEGIKNVAEISREYCRSFAEKNFSISAVAERYINIYSKIINENSTSNSPTHNNSSY